MLDTVAMPTCTKFTARLAVFLVSVLCPEKGKHGSRKK